MGLFRSTPARDNGAFAAEEEAADRLEEGQEVSPISEGPRPSQTFMDGRGTILGQGQTFEGTLKGEGTIRLDGLFRGDIVLQGSVSITAPGALVGSIEATSVLVAGAVEGNITAHGKARLAYGCKVRGDIQSESLAVEDGASFDGRSTMLVPEEGAALPQPGAALPPLEDLQFGRNYVPETDEAPADEVVG